MVVVLAVVLGEGLVTMPVVVVVMVVGVLV